MRSALEITNRFIAPLILMLSTAAFGAPALNAASLNEFRVEIPQSARELGSQGKPLASTHALVTIATPSRFDPALEWPVMVISSTADPGYPSRQMLRDYREQAEAAGWVLIAADPAEAVTQENDHTNLRFALNLTALKVLELHWPLGSKAPLAFGGFSGGAKISGWLAAAFAGQGRNVIGVFLAGINQATLPTAGYQFEVMSPAFKRVPIFVLSGEQDKIASPADHRVVIADMRLAGFKRIRLATFPGQHTIYATPLLQALDWFSQTANETNGTNFGKTAPSY